jgi:hypothetical protein
MLTVGRKFLMLAFEFDWTASSHFTARLDDPIFGAAIAAPLDGPGLSRLVGAACLTAARHNAGVGTERAHGFPARRLPQFGKDSRGQNDADATDAGQQGSGALSQTKGQFLFQAIDGVLEALILEEKLGQRTLPAGHHGWGGIQHLAG